MNLKLIMLVTENKETLLESTYECILEDGAKLAEEFNNFLKTQAEGMEYIADQKKKNPDAMVEISIKRRVHKE